jgi:hypothetical protein
VSAGEVAADDRVDAWAATRHLGSVGAMTRPYAILAGAAALLLAIAPPPAAAVEADVALLQGLDKVTARTRTFMVPVDSTKRFGGLEITVRHCETTPPEEPPENKAFLEIVDLRPDRDPEQVFSGWMFSSSPALNALEHPVYDVWVKACLTEAEAAERERRQQAPDAPEGVPIPAQLPPSRE